MMEILNYAFIIVLTLFVVFVPIFNLPKLLSGKIKLPIHELVYLCLTLPALLLFMYKILGLGVIAVISASSLLFGSLMVLLSLDKTRLLPLTVFITLFIPILLTFKLHFFAEVFASGLFFLLLFAALKGFILSMYYGNSKLN